MKYELIIFDLDGTLLDTLDDLAAAVNHALGLRGFPPRGRDEVRRLIGNGIASTVRRAVPTGTDEETIHRTLADFKACYLRSFNVHTRPFPGVPALLDELWAAGIAVAVNSNKVDGAVNALCEAHFRGCIALALGERADIAKKPAPDGVRLILDSLKIAGDKALYVGDGETDLLTARNAGIDCAWVSWGYRTREELDGIKIPRSFDTAEALRRFILD